MSECEKIDNNMYYYLRIGGKWNVYVYIASLIVIKKYVASLSEAKNLAKNFAKMYKEVCDA